MPKAIRYSPEVPFDPAELRRASEKLLSHGEGNEVPVVTQTGLADLVRGIVAQDSVKLTTQGKRRLRRLRNDLDLPDLASAVDIAAALYESLIDFTDPTGAITVVNPTTKTPVRLQVR